MSRPNEHINEHILAAFLTGNLPAPLRREIASYIAQNERARDLLTMANDAMEVVDSGDGSGDGSGIRLGDGFSHRKRRSPHHRAHVPVSVASQEDESNTTLWKVAAVNVRPELINIFKPVPDDVDIPPYKLRENGTVLELSIRELKPQQYRIYHIDLLGPEMAMNNKN